ncbi:MAG: hypothetical protein A3K19_08570 [Lentisphaerae bacterium RIFOXYB12_FULL_65_16]|nr:MAG: hypothetical protein A3K18_22290 [Lentisphaerae bacterium RIFOXYA12_64_32]OGV90274.1 MAG: hypothetical protein A3K19_08570 [Lentisphaerae bacterium RIFOXYB12_FULL_65_16]
MATTLTPRQRVERSLRGGHSDRVPFTIYESKIPQCARERQMRNRGLCIVNRHHNVFSTHTPNVKARQVIEYHNGKPMTRTVYETPVGSVSTLVEPAGFTSWWHERMYKTPDDFKVLLFMIKDEVYEPRYDAFLKAEQDLGEDMILRAGFGLEPLQMLISGTYLDMETFCVEWMDHRDELLELYAALVENRRKIYPLVAQSPALHANYGGNVTPEIIGLENFEKYYVQHYNEAAEVMHKHGKLIGSHLDANCKLLSKAIAGTALDYIEAFTPAPDTDMTLAQARDVWPDKVLWLNFPSSVHLRSDKKVEQFTVDMVGELKTIDGLIMGITEDIPPDRWQFSCTAIMDGLDRHAQTHPELYL